MNELLRELQEDIQRDRWAALWKRYGQYAIGASIAVVVATAVAVGYRHWQDGRNRELTSQWLAAEEQAKSDVQKGLAALAELTKKAPASMRPLIDLRRAALLREQDKETEAQALVKDVVANTDPRDMFGALVHLQAQAAGSDPVTPEASPYPYTAQELAAWQDMESGRLVDARAAFETLARTSEAPASLRERAQLALAALPPGTDAKKEAANAR